MKGTIILVTNNGMGNADLALKHKLISNTGSPVLEQLKALEANGVRLIICSTCLDYYDLSGQTQVGIIGGMTDIIEAQTKAAKVITI